MKSYDIFLTQENSGSHLDTGCICRRFTAASIDVLIVAVVVVFLGIEGTSNLAGLFNLSLLLVVLFLPEFLWRQTIGMFICNIVVLVPPQSHPIGSLLIRRLLNLLEFALPSAIYYFIVSFSKNNRSISDRVSSCVIVRKRYLFDSHSTPPSPGIYKKICVPLLFTLFPMLLFAAAFFTVLQLIDSEVFWEYFIDHFDIESTEQDASPNH